MLPSESAAGRNARLAARLSAPTGGGAVSAVLDTDTYNEIDDQFAIAYMLNSPDRIKFEGITAAPFYRDPAKGIIRSSDPGDGMERSYNEILKVLDVAGRQDMNGRVFRGARTYLPDERTPVRSAAAEAIIDISKTHDEDNPLYVLAIAAITNVASALLMDPSLADRICIVWLGGQAHHWGGCDDFNAYQDIAAARVVFGCSDGNPLPNGVPLVQFPNSGVVSAFALSRPELEYWFRGRNALCDYLIDNTYEFAANKFHYEGWSKVLWDPTTVTWLLAGSDVGVAGSPVGCPGDASTGAPFVRSRIVPAPMPQYDLTYSFSADRHPIRYVYHVEKDVIIHDMARRIGGSPIVC